MGCTVQGRKGKDRGPVHFKSTNVESAQTVRSNLSVSD